MSILIPTKLDYKGFAHSVRRVKRDVGGFQREMEKQSRAIQNTLRFSIVFTGLAALPRITQRFQDFEKELTATKVVAGLAAGEMKSLQDEIMRVGSTSAQMNTDLARATTQMARMGMSGREIEAALAPAVQVAEAVSESLELVTSTIGRTVNALGLGTEGFQRVGDVMAQAASKGDVTVASMAQSFKFGAPAARGLGLAIEDLAAMVSIMGDNSIHGEMAGTALRSTMIRLTKDTGKVNKMLREYGVQVEVVNGRVTNFAEVIDALRDAGVGEGILGKIFGAESVAGIGALVNTTADTYEKRLADMNNAAGTAARMQEEQLDNLAGSWSRLHSQIDNAVLNLTGGTMQEFVRGVVDAIHDFLKYLNSEEGIGTLRKLGTAATYVAGALGVAGLGLAVNVLAKTFMFAIAPIRMGWVGIKAVAREAALATGSLGRFNEVLGRAARRAGRKGLAGKLSILGRGFAAMVASIGAAVLPLALVYAGFMAIQNIDMLKQTTWFQRTDAWFSKLALSLRRLGVEASAFRGVFRARRDSGEIVAELAEIDALERKLDKTLSGQAGYRGEGSAAGNRGAFDWLWGARDEVGSAMAVDTPAQRIEKEAVAVKETWGEAMDTVAKDTGDTFKKVTRSVADSRMHVAREAIGAIGEVNKAAFKSAKVAKGVAIADAIWNGARAVQRAFAEFPFPYSGIVANLMMVKTAAQISQIRKTDFRGQAHDGLTNVPATGTYILQQGEMVASRNQNAMLQEFLSREREGASAPVINQIQIPDDGDVFTLTRRQLVSLNGQLDQLARGGMRTIAQPGVA